MKRKPKLLVLTSTYPRWAGDAEPGFVHELSRRLTRQFEVTVVCPAASGAARREVMDGVEVRRFRYAPDRFQTLVNDGGMLSNLKHAPLKWLLVPLFLAAELLAIRRALRRIEPAVIHAHWIVPQGVLLALLSVFRRSRPPVLMTSHGADLFGLRSPPLKMMKRWAARRAELMTVVSKPMADELEALGVDADKIFIEPMGVDLSQKFTPDDAVDRSSDELLFVGRLVEKKGLRYLLEAMPLVRQRHPTVRLTVAGFGPEEPALRQQAEALALGDCVRFLGPVSQDDLPELYRKAALFVAPFVEAEGGDQEGLGLVTVEAIGCGCPVIVSNLPAVADVIEDDSLRVRPADPDGLASAIISQMQRDRSDLSRQAEYIRKRVFSRFDWSARVKDYEKLLLSAAQAPS